MASQTVSAGAGSKEKKGAKMLGNALKPVQDENQPPTASPSTYEQLLRKYEALEINFKKVKEAKEIAISNETRAKTRLVGVAGFCFKRASDAEKAKRKEVEKERDSFKAAKKKEYKEEKERRRRAETERDAPREDLKALKKSRNEEASEERKRRREVEDDYEQQKRQKLILEEDFNRVKSIVHAYEDSISLRTVIETYAKDKTKNTPGYQRASATAKLKFCFENDEQLKTTLRDVVKRTYMLSEGSAQLLATATKVIETAQSKLYGNLSDPILTYVYKDGRGNIMEGPWDRDLSKIR
ncbi:hypothetical protein HK104_009194, partial [Borealophlyctis nickersoniae]